MNVCASLNNKKIILNYYRKILGLARQLNLYNFRDHSLRKIRHDFRCKFNFNL